MNFETSKMLGGIGALMMFICGLVTFFNGLAGGIIALIGLILVLISLNDLANFYKSRAIFNNALYGVIATIVGVVVAIAVAFFAGFHLCNISPVEWRLGITSRLYTRYK